MERELSTEPKAVAARKKTQDRKAAAADLAEKQKLEAAPGSTPEAAPGSTPEAAAGSTPEAAAGSTPTTDETIGVETPTTPEEAPLQKYHCQSCGGVVTIANDSCPTCEDKLEWPEGLR